MSSTPVLSADPIPDLAEYARVENGVIVEYPVYAVHIRNRGLPFDWFLPVVTLGAAQTPPPFHFSTSSLTVQPNAVVKTQHFSPMGLQDLLNEVHKASRLDLPDEPPAPTPTVDQLDPALLAEIFKQLGYRLTQRMNAFAQERDYDTIDTLASWKDSTIPKYKVEGGRGFQLRDDTWKAYEAYKIAVLEGKQTLPAHVDGFDPLFPALTWA